MISQVGWNAGGHTRCGLLDVRARERVEAHGGLRVLRGKFNHRVRLPDVEEKAAANRH
jgi:hypothetical protein